MNILLVPTKFWIQRLQKNCHAKDMTFPNKPYNKWDKVGKLVFVPISYERSDEDEMERDPNNNIDHNNHIVVSDSIIDEKEDKKRETFFEPKIDDDLEATPETTLSP